MIKNRPLFICPEYGTNDVNAVIEDIIISSLDESNFQPTVLCTGKGKRNDRIQTIEVKHNPIIKRIEYHLRTFIMTPDTYLYSWAIPSIFSILRIKKDFTYIHSVSVPYSTHFIGYFIHKWYKIPWIAHFFEPWEDNPYARPNKNFIYKYFLKKWETLVARNADIIIHNNSIIIDSWKRKYGIEVSNKMFLLPLPFDPCTLNKTDYTRKDDCIIISHIGNLYGQRNAKLVITAVKELICEHPYLIDKLTMNFVGKISQSDIDLIKCYNLEKIFNCIGSISEEQCSYYYNNSDYYLVIEGKEQGSLFFPSKILKYFYYGKPIIGITTKGSVLDEELIQSNNISIYHNEIEKIKDVLLRILLNDTYSANNKKYWEKFCITNVVKEYVKILDGI